VRVVVIRRLRRCFFLPRRCTLGVQVNGYVKLLLIDVPEPLRDTREGPHRGTHGIGIFFFATPHSTGRAKRKMRCRAYLAKDMCQSNAIGYPSPAR
jgi:hypothetical protein